MRKKHRLIIMGAGIVGQLMAMYVRKRLPEIEVTIVGHPDKKRPIVGESTVEVTAHFLEGLGLGALLEEKHYHKYGLTYYFKLSPDPACRRYVIHEAPGVLRMPAYNLNRTTFDTDIRAINRSLGVGAVEAMVTDADLGMEGRVHRLRLRHPDGREEEMEADWVVDATGRSRFLARKLELAKQPPYQRSCFWFRLRGFDRTRLQDIQATRVEHHCYDPYYVTHHFYARGYWVWLIPMRAPDGNDLISIGITHRPEILGSTVTTLDQFLEVIRKDHPVIAELVETGSIVDENALRDYMYEATQYYSKDGWFLIGDAAFTFDPANSAGLAYIAHQVPQIAAMIRKDMDGRLTDRYIDCLERHLNAQLTLQDTWSKWYDVMHEPLKMAWTLLVANMAYFHVVLPNYVNGAFLDGHQALQFAELLPRVPPDRQPPSYPFPCLLDAITEQYARVPETCLPNLYHRTVNWGIYRADEQARPRFAARYFWMLAVLRLRLLGMVHWRPTVRHARLLGRHLRGALSDASKALVLRVRPRSFYRHGDSPPDLVSPFPGGTFLGCRPHAAAATPPLADMNGNRDGSRELQPAPALAAAP